MNCFLDNIEVLELSNFQRIGDFYFYYDNSISCFAYKN